MAEVKNEVVMKVFFTLVMIMFLLGCSQEKKASEIKKTEVISVTVIDGIDGNQHKQYSSRGGKLFLQSDGDWVIISSKSGKFNADTYVYYHRLSALVKYSTKE